MELDRLPKIRNLGPVSMKRLHVIGIHQRSELEALGAVEVYLRTLDVGFAANLNLLWALQGAILDIGWTEIPPAMKKELLTELESRSSEVR